MVTVLPLGLLESEWGGDCISSIKLILFLSLKEPWLVFLLAVKVLWHVGHPKLSGGGFPGSQSSRVGGRQHKLLRQIREIGIEGIGVRGLQRGTGLRSAL